MTAAENANEIRRFAAELEARGDAASESGNLDLANYFWSRRDEALDEADRLARLAVVAELRVAAESDAYADLSATYERAADEAARRYEAGVDTGEIDALVDGLLARLEVFWAAGEPRLDA